MSAALQTNNDNNHAPVKPMDADPILKPGQVRRSRLLLPAMAAAFGIGGTASAFELGGIEVHSTLGQPLRASIAYALHPNEEISSYCIYLAPGRSGTGLPSAGPASVAVEDGVIRLAGRAVVSDPLLALQLTVDCPYAAHLSREYVAFVDPPVTAVSAAAPANRPAAREPSRAARAAAPAARAARAPIAASTTYRVQPGDTLSGIAERLSGRTVTIWQAVEALFAANPAAFIGGDRDFLKAGAILRVPDAIYAAGGGAVAERAPAPAPAAQSAPAETSARSVPASTPYIGYRSESARIESGRAVREAAPAASPPVTTPRRAPEATPAQKAVADDGPFVTPEEPAGPGGTAPAETVPAAILPERRPGTALAPLARAPAASGGAWSWLIWLGGSGIALILALLLGRPLRKRFGGEAGVPFDDERSASPRESAPPAVVATPEPVPDTSGLEVDFHFDEADAGLGELDVDVADGGGLKGSGDLDIAQDFGFSASDGLDLGLDIEFPEEPATGEAAETNVLPTMQREGDVIVEEEVPPGSEETGAYDVSMIVDATQQPVGDSDATTRDLHAIELEAGAPAQEEQEDPFTLSREMDYKILEQDYQEELTATQALNSQLENAARDLAERLEADEAASPDAPTAEFPALSSEPTAPHPAAVALAEADTVEMPAAGDDEDTGVNEELKDYPAAVNDATAEMEIESATVDTKKMKVS